MLWISPGKELLVLFIEGLCDLPEYLLLNGTSVVCSSLVMLKPMVCFPFLCRWFLLAAAGVSGTAAPWRWMTSAWAWETVNWQQVKPTLGFTCTPCSTPTSGYTKSNFVWKCAHRCTNLRLAVRMNGPPPKLCHLSTPNYKLLKLAYIWSEGQTCTLYI